MAGHDFVFLAVRSYFSCSGFKWGSTQSSSPKLYPKYVKQHLCF